LVVLCTDGLTDNLLHSDVHRVVPLLISLPALDGPIADPCPFSLVGHRGGVTTKSSSVDEAKAPIPPTSTNLAAAAAAAKIGHIACSPHPPTAEELLDKLWNVAPVRPTPSSSSSSTPLVSTSPAVAVAPPSPVVTPVSTDEVPLTEAPMVRSISSPQAAVAHAASMPPISIESGLGVGGLGSTNSMMSSAASHSHLTDVSAGSVIAAHIDAKVAEVVNTGAFLPFPLLRSTTSFLRDADLPPPSHILTTSTAPSTTTTTLETKASAPSASATPTTTTTIDARPRSNSKPVPPLPSTRPSVTSKTVAIQSRIRSETSARRHNGPARFSLSSPASLPVATAAVRLYHYIEWITRSQRAHQDDDYASGNINHLSTVISSFSCVCHL
jgi:hypothetical protein